ncbi:MULTISPECIES: hypothetical protein [Halobacterium]|uniref:hypothetical protein n=1 Tax=Halobacterium TaxID=2239 RepID=UPI001964E25E|nr:MULTISPECIES: hypothetical protein [Halobacterium]MDL0133563.1 hypothetical protein [Halobacterium salinarum]QRY26384.1 hypothetical protein JRZ79_13115 [Halobacterium sp. BOL4-2]
MAGEDSGRGDHQPDDWTTLDDIADSESVEVECSAHLAAPETCDGWGETVDLDEPAYVEDGRLFLPGFSWTCPECGNPHSFRIDGVEVSNLV